jgi:glycosyltransferase involved in cell wall biosynthesis
MRQLLVIAYDFPPSSVGIWRTLKFCRYMVEFGWMPSVLTVEPVRSARTDWGPMAELPEGVEVRRTESLDPQRLAWRLGGGAAAPAAPGTAPARLRWTSRAARAAMEAMRRWVFLPDQSMGWYPFATAAARRWMRERRFDAVYTTSFPHTAHLVGAAVAGATPWLADFRDIWIGNDAFHRPATPLHAAIHRAMERRVVTRASRVLAATAPITADFRRRHSDLPADRFATLTNGYDPADFPPPGAATDHDPTVYTIVYAGTLFGDRSPEPFLRAVRRVIDRDPAAAAVLRLRFLGSMTAAHRRAVESHGLGAITRIEGYQPHNAALAAMQAADMLLLIVEDTPGNHIMLTQKVFEYAAARRPILGLVPEGAAREFLEDLGEGPVVHPNDEQGIAAAVEDALAAWRRDGRRVLGDNARLRRYHRRELTRELVSHLDAIVAR